VLNHPGIAEATRPVRLVPVADVHVRSARQQDAAAIARIQLLTWRTAYADALPAGVLEALDERDVAEQWESAITAPPSTGHRVLVACEASNGPETVVGFAAAGPADAEDLAGPHEATDQLTGAAIEPTDPAELADPPAGIDWDRTTVAVGPLLVEPRWGRRGHGSRLLAAVVDLARGDGARRGVAWILDADVASRKFLESTGWQPDGIGRLLDMDGVAVGERRLVTDLTAG
jgi:GNAT superfamily N-acetyltransferase